MWIVYIGKVRHSAWQGSASALHQKTVLEDNGYKYITIKYDETVSTENGHYYV